MCSRHKVIHEIYDDLLGKHDYSSIILKSPLRRVRTYVHALFSHREFSLQSSNPASQESVTYKNFIWSPRSKLASLQTLKNLFYSALSLSLSLTHTHQRSTASCMYIYKALVNTLLKTERNINHTPSSRENITSTPCSSRNVTCIPLVKTKPTSPYEDIQRISDDSQTMSTFDIHMRAMFLKIS